MDFNLQNYSSDHYKIQSESRRAKLVRDLTYSDFAQKINLLKSLYQVEPNLQIKFDIRRAIDDLENAQAPELNIEVSMEDKLKKALGSADQSLRHKALGVVVKNRRTDFLPLLRSLKKIVEDPYISAAILKLLSLNPVRNIKEISSYLKSPDERVIATVLQILGVINSTQSLAMVVGYLSHENNRIRTNAAIAFEKSDPIKAKKVIETMAYSEHIAYRSSAAYALGVTTLSDVDSILDFLLTDSDEGVRERAYQASKKLEEIKRKVANRPPPMDPSDEGLVLEHLDDLIAHLDSTDNPRQISNLLSRCHLVTGSKVNKIKVLSKFLKHSDARIRANALESLGQLHSDDERQIFTTYLKDDNNRVIGNAIFRLCDEDHCPDEYYSDIVKAFNELTTVHGVNGCLTTIYCIGNCRDERFVPYLISLADSEQQQVADKSFALAQAWAENSEYVKNELRSMIERSSLIHDLNA